MKIDRLPGFREFYPDECALRNHLFRTLRKVARNFSFQEYDAPVLEPLDLYIEKSGPEIVGQLFNFEDKGGRPVSLRPEMTPSLARMVGSKSGSMRRPIKWFSIGEQFRYERMQKGRLRSFYQFNADVLGEEGVGADAELVTLLIACLQGLGLNESHFHVRLSDRNLWYLFLESKRFTENQISGILGVVDKSERMSPEKLRAALCGFIDSSKVDSLLENIWEIKALDELDKVRDYFSEFRDSEAIQKRLENWGSLFDSLDAMGVLPFISVDLSIVRGLAYYTGFVFEAFERSGKSRALAGGGRYDNLVGKLTPGSDMTATGFAIGDVTLVECLKTHELLPKYLDSQDLYVVIGGSQVRLTGLGIVGAFRKLGFSVSYSLKDQNLKKQLKDASQRNARLAIIVGSNELDQGMVLIKDMVNRKEVKVSMENLVRSVDAFFTDGKL